MPPRPKKETIKPQRLTLDERLAYQTNIKKFIRDNFPDLIVSTLSIPLKSIKTFDSDKTLLYSFAFSFKQKDYIKTVDDKTGKVKILTPYVKMSGTWSFLEGFKNEQFLNLNKMTAKN